MTLDTLRLVPPGIEYRDSFLEGMAEMETLGEETELDGPVEDICRAFPAFLQRLTAFARPDPALGRVPMSQFWLIDEDGYAGRLDLRHRLNDRLRSFGGHIGYDIRPSRRQRGYGTRALQLGLEEARKLELDRVLVTCSEYNVPSRRIIEANGGVLEDMIETRFRPELTCRYWIEL